MSSVARYCRQNIYFLYKCRFSGLTLNIFPYNSLSSTINHQTTNSNPKMKFTAAIIAALAGTSTALFTKDQRMHLQSQFRLYTQRLN